MPVDELGATLEAEVAVEEDLDGGQGESLRHGEEKEDGVEPEVRADVFGVVGVVGVVEVVEVVEVGDARKSARGARGDVVGGAPSRGNHRGAGKDEEIDSGEESLDSVTRRT